MSDVSLKGERDGLAISIGLDGDFDEICSAIVAHLERGGAFFRGGKVLLDVGLRPVSAEELELLQALLAEHDVYLSALRGSDPDTRAAAREMGLELPFTPTAPTVTPMEQFVPASGEPALIVHRTLRSGQAIMHEAGVVILGDVNPGAEVIAGGDVIVFGALRGVVHAGAGGNEESVVCALDLAPMQLRIGGHITRAPDEKSRRPWWSNKQSRRRPEVARVQGNTIVVEAWSRSNSVNGLT